MELRSERSGGRGGALPSKTSTNVFFFIFSISLVPVGNLDKDIKSSFVPIVPSGTKARSLLSRKDNPGWETGTKTCSDPDNIHICSSLSWAASQQLLPTRQRRCPTQPWALMA